VGEGIHDWARGGGWAHCIIVRGETKERRSVSFDAAQVVEPIAAIDQVADFVPPCDLLYQAHSKVFRAVDEEAPSHRPFHAQGDAGQI
jgi:hypothetical protein